MRTGGLPGFAEDMSTGWEFLKKYYENPDWGKLVDDANDFYKKSESDFLGGLLIYFIDVIEKNNCERYKDRNLIDAMYRRLKNGK